MMTKNTSTIRTLSKTLFSAMVFSLLFLACTNKSKTNNEELTTGIKYEIPDAKTGNLKEVSKEEYLEYRKLQGGEATDAYYVEVVEEATEKDPTVPHVTVNYEYIAEKHPIIIVENKEDLKETTLPDGKKVYEISNIVGNSSFDGQDPVYTNPEVKPEFKGGMQAFYQYIKDNLKIPEVEKDVKENVIVSFIVEKDGSLSNIKILRDPVGMEKEVTEMLTACPKWKPGTQDGKPVRVEYTLPIAVSIKAAKK